MRKSTVAALLAASTFALFGQVLFAVYLSQKLMD
jgi:hypothetical protein